MSNCYKTIAALGPAYSQLAEHLCLCDLFLEPTAPDRVWFVDIFNSSKISYDISLEIEVLGAAF